MHAEGPALDALDTAFACSATPADPSACVPEPRDVLSELDEAVQAVWRGADAKEIGGILKWATVTKVKDLPKGTKIIGSTVQRKFKRDGTPKTRVCVQGFSQIPFLHYDRTHSPTICHSSCRALCAVGAAMNASIEFCDFTMAYTQSALKPSEYI